MHLSALHIYPVKSCRGLSVTAAELDDHGFVGDRRFMVVSAEDGKFLTQRTHPRMALIETALTKEALVLSSSGRGAVTIPRNASAGVRRVTVWKSTTSADDCGDEPAEWLSDFLGLPLRLVRMGGTYQRPIVKPTARPGDVVTFADAYPLLVISEATLADLNDRLIAKHEEPLPMNRFRPNLVVTGCAPYGEDAWTQVRIGHVVLRNAGLCARCPITTTDQLTAVRGKEPLQTLATYRRDQHEPTNVNFGTNLIHETKRGTLRVGDPVELA
ncbi:MAG: MOSC N-terminal beta barrel domain-containing protein [bacterium]|nr:MOSC N-terminal beta barrel domain-containing protein [bacterium]MDI1334620.1 MOSC N-terminal beta barrel domain-containing protein [Lacunisphaera sp.]